MSNTLIGKAVEIPALKKEGIVCGYSMTTNSYSVEVEGGWISDLKETDMIPLLPHRAPSDS